MSQRMKVSIALLVCMLAICGYLLARIWGNIANVFPDEYIHSKFARFTDLHDINIPSYLYYAVYSFTAFFDDQFLNVARVINVVFYLSGCYLIYVVARRFLSDLLASYVAIFAALSPMNTYVNYFMAESMFFFFFWLFLASVFYDLWRTSIKGNVWIGLIFGSLLLVKPHALLILPAYPLALLMSGSSVIQNVKSSFVFVTAALLLKFAIGFLISGSDGLTLFGSLYSRHATDIISGTLDIPYAIRSVWINLLGNAFALASVLGLALVYIFIIIPKSEVDSSTRFMKWLIIWILAIMVPFVSVFATTAALFDDNINYRIYMRYYNYAFPLIYIYAFTHLKIDISFISKSERMGLVSIVAAPIIYAAYLNATSLLMLPYKVLGTDTPEYFLLKANSVLYYAVVVVTLLIMIRWVFKPRQALIEYLVVYIPICMLVTGFNNLKSIQGKDIPTTSDHAGRSAAQIIPEAEHGNVLVIGTHDLELTRFLIHLKSGLSDFKEMGVDDTLHIASIDASKRWIVVIGKNKIIGDVTHVHKGENYIIYKRD